MSPSLFSNFSVYYDNLSVYYVGTILLSFLAVFLTWWLLDSERKHPQDDTNHVGPALTFTRTYQYAIQNESCVKHILMFAVVFSPYDY
jgi:Na+/melibiose symporter-like transporter